MSANRSVQAAQRRRAGGPEPAAPGRGPQPSINSSQMFSSQQQQQQQQQPGQQRSGQISSGRLAGQHAQLQQQQQQQMQQHQQQDAQQANGIGGISKMTFAQAVTLITLRLGKIETQLFELNSGHVSHGFQTEIEGNENMVMVDKSLMDSIMSRLESLEKRSSTPNTSSPEITILKQQFETIKPAIAQNTKANNTLTKEQKEHKQQIDSLKAEMNETKDLLAALQTLSMDNSQKIFTMMSGGEDINDNDDYNINDNINDGTIITDINHNLNDDTDANIVDNEVIGTDLKGLIEQELNA